MGVVIRGGSEMAEFSGKVALVTGGTAGIGRAAAVAFATAGAKVVVSGRRQADGDETVRLIRAAGGEGLFVAADVSREADVQKMVEATLKAYGRLDVAFNNAGVEQIGKPLLEQNESDYHAVMDVNVKGVFACLRHEIAAMLRSGGGAIVNNASVAGLIGMIGAPVYTASKHAVIGLTKAVAIEFAKQGVRVNAIAPGAVDTSMMGRVTEKTPREKLERIHPMNRFASPEEIASGVLWLCSPGASFVTGATLSLDGGFTAQ
jgi:NAD(P)-dependent dehydrogenase (short-subunit alcohol dehydrogenase family)